MFISFTVFPHRPNRNIHSYSNLYYFFKLTFWQFFFQTRNYSIYCDVIIFDYKIEPCRFPNLWLRRNNGTFTVLRCTVGIRCFTVSVYFLLQINFFKSTFDLFFDLFGLSLFYENFDTKF